jgi:PhnB protein
MEAQTPPGCAGKILHATLAVGPLRISGADCSPDTYRKPGGFSIMINLKDAAEAARVFEQLAEDGEVRMPLQTTFWAQAFGLLTDRFGTPWMINCEAAA